MATLVLTDAWQQIATTATKLVLTAGYRADLYIGSTAPAASDTGLDVSDEYVLDIDNLNTLGGNAWVRGSGTVTYFSG